MKYSQALDLEYRELLSWAADADMTNEANYQKVCNSIDIQSFIDMVVIETYINNTDWATEYMNNWISWRATEADASIAFADGKWRYILYDLDFSADYFDDARTLAGFDALNNMFTGNDPYNFVPIFYNLLNNESFSRLFYDSYIDVMKNNFDPVDVSENLDGYVEKYGAAIAATNIRFGQEWVDKNYAAEVEAFRQYFIDRRNLAKMYLDRLYGVKFDMTEGQDIVSNESTWSYYGDASAVKSDGVFTLTANKASTNSWDIQSQSQQFTIEKGKTYTEISYETELVNELGDWHLYNPSGEGALTVKDVNSVTVETIALPDEIWEVQALYSGMVFDAGKTYTYSFTIKSDTNTSITAHVQKNYGDYEMYSYESVSVATAAKRYTYTFTADDSCIDASIYFDCGSSLDTIEISDVSIICVN